MVLARLKSSSVARVVAAFAVAVLLLSLETRGPFFSRLSFIGLPVLLAVGSANELLIRLIHFIVLAEVMVMLLLWPVSVLSKAMLISTAFWYLSEFPNRALTNLAIAVVVVLVTLVSAPVTQQF